ncbi:hypothetical protein [Saccharomonospora azurea]|uniref:hypothetical protein n=1 Tax=Saccharomonospora azurea TaxID=40988 RepID=UPI003D8CE855
MSRGLLVLDTGETRRYDPPAWVGVLVVVADGELELETVHGHRRRFGHGSVLALSGLPLRLLRAVTPTTLIILSRR